MKVCGYARVSTKDQQLEQQIQAIERFCGYKGFEMARLYQDVMSGAKAKRPGYLEMVQGLRNMEYGGVVVFRLDRLGRNARELSLLIEELEHKGIKVISIHESFDTSTAIGRAMLSIICTMAQLEREQIGEATKQRLQALKAAGKRIGRRKAASPGQIRKVREYAAQGFSPQEIKSEVRLGYGTIWRIVHKRGVYGDRGKKGQQ